MISRNEEKLDARDPPIRIQPLRLGTPQNGLQLFHYVVVRLPLLSSRSLSRSVLLNFVHSLFSRHRHPSFGYSNRLKDFIVRITPDARWSGFS